jgi:division protein CdvB (Snf7/Vps24/ESCRT-III family)
MNRNMNLPAIQRIAMEFERENDMMDQRQEMMDDVIDDAFEDEEEETDEIVNQVLDEIGIDLSQSVCPVRRISLTVSSERLRKAHLPNNSPPQNVYHKPLERTTISKPDSTV